MLVKPKVTQSYSFIQQSSFECALSVVYFSLGVRQDTDSQTPLDDLYEFKQQLR